MVYIDIMRTKYDQFGGRADRREFWLFWLVHLIVITAATLIDREIFVEWAPVSTIYVLATFVPMLSIGARRLHDVGHSGWIQLLMVFWVPAVFLGSTAWVPNVFDECGLSLCLPDSFGGTSVWYQLSFVSLLAAIGGTFLLFVFALFPSDRYENDYGADPFDSPSRPAVLWTVVERWYYRFGGRASRKEFWLYILEYYMLSGIALTLDKWWFADVWEVNVSFENVVAPDLITYLLALGVASPTLAVAARRLHDTGRSGWWLALPLSLYAAYIIAFVNWLSDPSSDVSLIWLVLINLLLLGGSVVLVVWLAQRGPRHANQHGDPPFEPA